ncbi:MAG: polyprenyl synthetase family protein [Chloroflexota bacterium]
MELSEIYEPIKDDLVKVERGLRGVSKVGYEWLARLLEQSVGGGGKQIRPALTLLSGRFYDYNLTKLLPMAIGVELLHTATLVHDDAIDHSAVRRGRPTINSIWGEDKAVLLGDYLFAKAGEFTATTKNLRAIMLFTQTLETISSGEINQIFNSFRLEQTREDYIQRIAAKTASLFTLSTESGTVLSRAPARAVQVLRNYGYNLGIAFQIVDDILDFIGTEEELGKPVGSDLSQGTLTLPAMLLNQRYPKDNPVKTIFGGSSLPAEEKQKLIRQAIEMVRGSPIVAECYEMASGYARKACAEFNLLPDKDSRPSLEGLAEFVVQRKV